MDAALPERKPNRLREWDYSQAGYYFITICARDKAPLFWEGVGADIIRPHPGLSRYGKIVDSAIRDMPNHYGSVRVDKYVVMPNHIHLILALAEPGGRMLSAPTKPVSTIVGQMKRSASKAAGMQIWQKGFHDHIIRGEADYLRIWGYIDTNPAKWREDRYYAAGCVPGKEE